MTRKVTSITKQGKTEPFYLQVAEQQIAFHKSIFKITFPYNASSEWLKQSALSENRCKRGSYLSAVHMAVWRPFLTTVC